MKWFSRSRMDSLRRYFANISGLPRPDKSSLYFLNGAQFLGVLNDNIFKLVIAYLLIDIQGQHAASTILSIAGAIFVVPFLLFSSSAGILADRFSKQRLLVLMKIVEMVIMGLAMIAFGLKSVWGSYTLLFLLATHSAMFGPSKYAIIAELVPADKVSRANGLITSFTYLGVIIGTFLASFLTSVTNRHFVFVAGACLLLAFFGFLSALGIQNTSSRGSSKKISSFFLRDIYETLKFCRGRTHLLVAITGAAYFLFIGAFAQLNIIPFAIESLGMNEIAGGYLFLSTALGIAFGAYLSGRASRTRIELGLPCLAGLLITIFLLFLSIASFSTALVVILLALLGVAGGLFIVPFDSFVQIFSPDEKRGQIIAANNFLSFCGVLLASFALYFYNQILGISPAQGFAITGILTFFVSLFMFSRLSDLAIPFFGEKLVRPFYDVRIEGADLLEADKGAILVLSSATWVKGFLLASLVPKIHFVLSKASPRPFPWFSWVIYSVHFCETDVSGKLMVETAQDLASDETAPCLFISSEALAPAVQPHSKLISLLKPGAPSFLYVKIEIQRRTAVIRISR